MVPAHMSNQLSSSASGDGGCAHQVPQQPQHEAKQSQQQAGLMQMQQHVLQQQQEQQQAHQSSSSSSSAVPLAQVQAVPISVTTASHAGPSATGICNGGSSPSAGSKRPREEQAVTAQPPLLSKLSKRPSIIGPPSVAAAIAAATNPNHAAGLPPAHPNPASDALRQHMSDQLASSYSAACAASIRAQYAGASASSSSQQGADPNSVLPRATSTHSLPGTSSTTGAALPSETATPAGSVAHRSVDAEKQEQEQQKRKQAAGSDLRDSMTRSLSCVSLIHLFVVCISLICVRYDSSNPTSKDHHIHPFPNCSHFLSHYSSFYLVDAIQNSQPSLGV